MEFAAPLSNLRTQLCVVLTGYGGSIDREAVWPEAAEEFLRRMNKLGVQLTIIGPRPPNKFGSKRTVRFMDRHEVVGLKELEASRSHRLEFRVLNKKTQAWTRLRAEACVTLGPLGVWPSLYEGWTSTGTLTVDALSRWLGEQKWVPGREFVFHGSSNQALRLACSVLDRGARSCHIVEEGPELRCWRGHRDRFISKGGRVLLKHQIQRVEQESPNQLAMYLANEQGTLILHCDTIVLAHSNDDALNAPALWKRGLFYVQKRTTPWEPFIDEEQWLERLDWREIYWRVGRLLELIDYGEADGALRGLRAERRRLLEYRKPGKRKDFGYSGKILNRETLSELATSPSVPRSFDHPKPVASLECFEHVACRACADACPENAIEKASLTDLPKLLEDKCTGCGACVAICPSASAVMVRELPVQQKARYFLPDDSRELWKSGRQLQMLNRRGEVLGTGRVISSVAYEGGRHRVLEVETTNVHLWEARGFRPLKGDYPEVVADEFSNSPTLLKRGWVSLNGVKRLCPIDVPITVALWQLGQRRFEDALFCHDGSCHLCEVTVDGKPALACKTPVRDGIAIEWSQRVGDSRRPLCPCKQVTREEYKAMLDEGAPPAVARELLGLGHGTCHGSWCMGSKEYGCELSGSAGAEKKPRPIFHGFEGSPWRDIWARDVSEPEAAVAARDEEDD